MDKMGWLKCPHCGEKTSDADGFCRECGEDLDNDDPQAAPEPRAKSRRHRRRRDVPQPQQQQAKGGCLRTILIVGAIAVVLVVGGIIYMVVTENDKRDKANADEHAVSVDGTYDEAGCGKETPVHVTIKNGTSDRTVKHVQFRVRTYVDGHSADLIGQAGLKDSTRILQPGGVSDFCIALPQFEHVHGATYTLKVEKEYVDFYEVGETIP